MWRKSLMAVIAALSLQVTSFPGYGLTINLNDIGGVGAGTDALAGFQAAAALWESKFSDNVTVNLDVGFSSLGSGILGSTSSSLAAYSYTSTFNAMVSDASSTSDASAVANLQATPSFELLLNGTRNNPNGVGSLTPYLDNDGDANNATIRIPYANAKALGLRAANDAATDASIQFSSNYSWDFDHTSPITPGFDFVGVAAHEIGHALGFISGVDILDNNIPASPNPSNTYYDNVFTYVSALDLFRFSTLSLSTGGAGTIDWTADTRAKFFSIDGGSSNLGSFSTGVNYGDGRQASHWKDNLGLGLMDPTFATGELGNISSLDSLAMDVIGWDLATTTVPVPGTVWLFGSGLLALLGATRRRRQLHS